MASHSFKAVVLDLFDTLVRWEPERLPEIEWRGRTIHSTIPWIMPAVAERLGDGARRERFLEVYHEVTEEIGCERERQWLEITCLERFVRTLERLGIPESDERARFAEHLTRMHMAGVRTVTSAPAANAEAVRLIAPKFRIGLLSNFDDAQTGREVLEDTGVADLFEPVIISAEVGLRKPNPKIYAMALAMLGLDAADVLFVGDTPREDILGPKQAGMRTAWVNRRRVPIPEGIPEPDFTIESIAELPAILGILR